MELQEMFTCEIHLSYSKLKLHLTVPLPWQSTTALQNRRGTYILDPYLDFHEWLTIVKYEDQQWKKIYEPWSYKFNKGQILKLIR